MNPVKGKYYDHEPAWRALRQRGLRGWHPTFDPRPIPLFIEQGVLRPADRVLELGCGGGEAAMIIAAYGCTVDACDASPTAIAIAEDNRAGLDAGSSERIRYYCCDLLKPIPMRFAEYDAVLDMHCWHCLVTPDDRAGFLVSARAALRPGGLLLSATMCGLPNQPGMRANTDPATRTSRDGRRYFAEEAEVRDMLARNRFSIVFWRREPDPDGADDLYLAARR